MAVNGGEKKSKTFIGLCHNDFERNIVETTFGGFVVGEYTSDDDFSLKPLSVR